MFLLCCPFLPLPCRSHNKALVDARARYYGDIEKRMAPHEHVSAKVAGTHMDATKQIQGDEESELAKIFQEYKPKADDLVHEFSSELGKLTKGFLKAFPAALYEEDPCEYCNISNSSKSYDRNDSSTSRNSNDRNDSSTSRDGKNAPDTVLSSCATAEPLPVVLLWPSLCYCCFPPCAYAVILLLLL